MVLRKRSPGVNSAPTVPSVPAAVVSRRWDWPRSAGLALLVGLFGVGACNQNGNGGALRVSQSAAVGEDATPPSVVITSPADGAAIADQITVTAVVSDEGGPVALAQLVVNGVAQQTILAPPYSFVWDARSLPEGPYQLTVMAVDAAGNLGISAPVNTVVARALASVTMTAAVVNGGDSLNGRVTLTGPAPASGLTVALTTTNPALAGVISNLPIRGGDSFQTFNVVVNNPAALTPVTLSASLRGVTKTVAFDVLAIPSSPIERLSVPSEVRSGTTINSSVTLVTNAIEPTTVFLSSDNPNVVVPPTVTVPAGARSGFFVVTTLAVSARTAVTLSAALSAGNPRTAVMALLPNSPTPISLTVVPTIIPVGQTATATVTLDAPAPDGGAVLTVSTFNNESPQVKGLAVPPTLTIPAGAQTGTFSVTALPLGGGFTGLQVSVALNQGGRGSQFLSVPRVLPVGNALFDFGMRVPRCQAVTAACDSGGLIDSRANLFVAAEPNFPNTINGSCADNAFGIGTGRMSGFDRGVYHFDQSLDRLTISTLDGSALAAGKLAKVDALVWGAGRFNLFSAPDATSPVWTLITTVSVTTNYVLNAVSTTFTLPAGSLQAIRGNFGISRLASSSCSTDIVGYDDYDDLVFAADNGGPPTNLVPRVDAGPDQSIPLPPVAILLGKATDDGLPGAPATLTTSWSKVSGPGSVTFSNATALVTAATFSVAGTYTLQLTASDGARSASDTVVVAVNNGGSPNRAPVVNAGVDQSITLPASANLSATVTDDGAPNPPAVVTLTWSKVDGPGAVTFGSPNSADTTATFSLPGTYTLSLTANDAVLTTTDTVVITVAPVPNRAPTANAGADQEITLPVAVATLAGTAMDDGLPTAPGTLAYAWSLTGGPAVTLDAANAPSTTVTFSSAGTYLLHLTVSDGELSAGDDVVVTVNPPLNVAPSVNAGADQTINLPGGAALQGTATDDGLPSPPAVLGTTWSKVSGPGVVTFADTHALLTNATFSVVGTYTLRLSADDGAASTSDDLVITVQPALNKAPLVNAGADKIVTLPAAAPLAGSVSDDGLPAGAVISTTWSRVSGPGTVSFVNAAALVTNATFSVAGSYVLRLRASDGALASTDDITITVNPVPTLKVQYRAVAAAVGDNVIRAGFNIVNPTTSPVPLSQLKLRYWYTVDTQRPQTVQCDLAQVGCANITARFVTVSPVRPGADRYLEIGFSTTAGSLAPGAQSGELQGRIRKSDSSNYNEANDYSYTTGPTVPAPTTLIDWTRVTLYRNGVKVWGTEP